MAGRTRGERGLYDHDPGLVLVKGSVVPVCWGEHSGAENSRQAAGPPAGRDMGGRGTPIHPLSKRQQTKSIQLNRHLVECRVALKKARAVSVRASTHDGFTID